MSSTIFLETEENVASQVLETLKAPSRVSSRLIKKRSRDAEDESYSSKRPKTTEPEAEVDGWSVSVEWPDEILKKKKNTTYYNSATVNGVTYTVGDTVALWPESNGEQGFMGTIVSMSTDGTNNNMECCWFYRQEETIFKSSKRNKAGNREVYASEHIDDNAIESIAKKVTVKPISLIKDMDSYLAQEDSYYFKKKYNHTDKCFEDLY